MVSELRALEVADFAMRKHVVSLGTSITKDAVMVDLIDEVSYWSINYSPICDSTLTLIDLAITESYVIATSTLNYGGRLWHFYKPTIAGMSLFQGTTTKYFDVGSNFSNRFIVKTIEDDIYVTAHVPFKNYVNTRWVYISKHLGEGYGVRYRLSESNVKYFRLQEIGTEKNKSEVQLLINVEYNDGIRRSVSYEIPTTVTLGTTIVYGHSIDDVYATSMDRTNKLGHYVMSGYDCTNGYNYYVKYQSSAYGSCIPIKSNEIIEVENFKVPHFTNAYYSTVHMLFIPIEHPVKKMSIMDNCMYPRMEKQTED